MPVVLQTRADDDLYALHASQDILYSCLDIPRYVQKPVQWYVRLPYPENSDRGQQSPLRLSNLRDTSPAIPTLSDPDGSLVHRAITDQALAARVSQVLPSSVGLHSDAQQELPAARAKSSGHLAPAQHGFHRYSRPRAHNALAIQHSE